MKKLISVFLLVISYLLQAQFSVSIEVQPDFPGNDAYVYTLDGSKDILVSKNNREGNFWKIPMKQSYIGMMKVYFPQTNTSVSFISENKDVKLKLNSDKDKLKDVHYFDEANILMSAIQDKQQKKELILPALYQIMDFYKPESNFGSALQKEIQNLSEDNTELNTHPFVKYYSDAYNKFLLKDPKIVVTDKDIREFIVNSNEYLETSSLLRPILVSYLNKNSSADTNEAIHQSVDALLEKVNIETPRGQTVLSELIDIFDVYAMTDIKKDYLDKAKNLKCTINDRLATTIANNNNTEIGSAFPDYIFKDPVNTKAKRLYDIKAAKKIVVFWSSTCSHCEKELPDLLASYTAFKNQNVEIIGISLDTDKNAYTQKVQSLPWINDTELKGWYSSFIDKYNVHATPTYYVLDDKNKIIAKPEHSKDVLAYFKL